MTDDGCAEYTAYVPYMSWGDKIADYRKTREYEVSQAAFANSIGIDLKRLQDLESNRADPTYEEHQKFADLWCQGDVDLWYIRDQGFAPSTPSQDKRALRELRHEHKHLTYKYNRYRTLLIEMLQMAVADHPRRFGEWVTRIHETMIEVNDDQFWPDSVRMLTRDDMLRKRCVSEDVLTKRQIKSLHNKFKRAWAIVDDRTRDVYLKPYRDHLIKLGIITDED